MTIIAITGDHPRHAYIVGRLAEAGLLAGWIIERRKAFVPTPPADCTGRLRELFVHHFDKRAQAEHRFFGEATDPALLGAPTLNVTPETLNQDATGEFIRRISPRLVLSYGCHKLSDHTRAASDATFWNIHGGLSPRYRGVATLFWPSYFLEPQCTGITLHQTTAELDGGGIIHQSTASMVRGDGLHDLSSRAVSEFGKELPQVLKKALGDEVLPSGPLQRNSGKLWLDADWRPEHLELIYDFYGDRIVDLVLDGRIRGHIPELVRMI